MSTHNGTPLSRGEATPPIYYNANAAGVLTGISPKTVRTHCPPDALLISVKGNKLYPVWTKETLKSWAAGRKARGGAR